MSRGSGFPKAHATLNQVVFRVAWKVFCRVSQFGDAGRSVPPWSVLLPGCFCLFSGPLPVLTTQFARRKQSHDTTMLAFSWLDPLCLAPIKFAALLLTPDI